MRFAGLVNAVLRRLRARAPSGWPRSTCRSLDTPDWLLARWSATYGEATAHAIAAANGNEPALDLTVKSDPRILGGEAQRPRAADRHGRAIAHGG